MLSLAANGLAQPDKKSEWIEKPFEPKYLQGDRANRVINFVTGIMVGRASIHWEPVLRQAVIIGSPDHVAHAEELLRKFDVPEVRQPTKTFEFTIYLVGAYLDAAHARGGPMPTDLDSVVTEMLAAFAYKSFGLLDAIPVSARNTGRIAEYDGILPVSAVGTNVKHFYKVFIDSPELLEDGKTVLARDFKFTVEIPSTASGNSSTLTIPVTGAADGDVVSLGAPNALASASGVCYTAYVSATNTVTVKMNNYNPLLTGNVNPAAGTFRVTVIKY